MFGDLSRHRRMVRSAVMNYNQPHRPTTQQREVNGAVRDLSPR